MTNEPIDIALQEWERGQPAAITKDPLWTLNCYRESLFLVDRVRDDVQLCSQAASLSDARGQLLTAVGSIAANIGERYGRMTSADRAKFLQYALGSTREALAWYRTLRPSDRDGTTADRVERLARIRRMLIGLLKRSAEDGGRKFDPW